MVHRNKNALALYASQRAVTASRADSAISSEIIIMNLLHIRVSHVIVVALALGSLVGMGARAADAPAPAAPASVSAEPQSTMSTYGDWTVRCQRETPTSPRVCEVAQSLLVQGQQTPIAEIAVGRVGPKDPMMITVRLPVSVSFPSTVQVFVGEKDGQPLDLTWRRCFSLGCYADAELKEETLKRFKAETTTGKMQFKDASGRDVTLPFSFRGFPQALDGLAKAQ